MRAAAIALGGAVVGGLFYLLLIDTRSLPELYVLCGVALLAGVAFLVSREEAFNEATFRGRWLRHAWRPFVRVPRDIVILSGAAFGQLLAPRGPRGQFRAVRFKGGHGSQDNGRRALTELLGSLAPNTIVLGVDPEKKLLLVHQLTRDGTANELDVLELG